MRNKKVADSLIIILLIMFGINVIIKIYFKQNFYLDMFGFVIEAALVGSIADWFAITALFKKPLGFPWHTAIIPRNREKVIDAIVSVVQNELLSEKVLREKIKEVNFIDGIIKFIDTQLKNENFNRSINELIIKLIDSIKPEKLSKFIDESLKNKLKDVDLSLFIGKAIEFSKSSKQFDNLLNLLIDEVIGKVNSEGAYIGIQDIINNMIQEKLNEAQGLKRMLMELALGVAKETNAVNVSEIAISIQDQIVEMLINLKNADDKTHIELIGKIEEIAEKLKTNEKIKEQVEKWKLETMEKISIYNEVTELISGILEAVKLALKNESQGENSYSQNINLLITWIKDRLNGFWDDFKINGELKEVLNRYIKGLVIKIIRSEHSYIGVIVRRVMSSMTDEDLNKFIEMKAGNDLHWIRINGCIVGAIFGALVFIFTNLIYLPLISRLFH